MTAAQEGGEEVMDLDEEDSEFKEEEEEAFEEEGEESEGELVEGWDDDENVVVRPAGGRSRLLMEDNDNEDESKDKVESLSS